MQEDLKLDFASIFQDGYDLVTAALRFTCMGITGVNQSKSFIVTRC